ncbi:response regulator [Photobacterium damselae]|uniref:response regulator n=1 Tax=Photobacterium damselae TaxID=38293 RepID=UPI0018A534A4|nr:response regulator [Photobacterium damselae]QOQ69482.1 response regulator [Photobacterium damselae subsp. damselae]
MNSFVILCLDDAPTVVQQLQQDLNGFSHLFDILTAQTIAEAYQILVQVAQNNQTVAMVLCDNDLGNDSGIDFLIELKQQQETALSHKVLLTGQAGLDETVQAVNNASLDYFIAKPWSGEALKQIVTDQLTTYIIENESDLMPWARILDTVRIMQAISDNRLSLSDC